MNRHPPIGTQVPTFKNPIYQKTLIQAFIDCIYKDAPARLPRIIDALIKISKSNGRI